jgi:hypothetical protein
MCPPPYPGRLSGGRGARRGRAASQAAGPDARRAARAQTSDLVNSGRFLARLQQARLNVSSVQLADLRIWGVSDRPHALARARPAPAARARLQQAPAHTSSVSCSVA